MPNNRAAYLIGIQAFGFGRADPFISEMTNDTGANGTMPDDRLGMFSDRSGVGIAAVPKQMTAAARDTVSGPDSEMDITAGARGRSG